MIWEYSNAEYTICFLQALFKVKKGVNLRTNGTIMLKRHRQPLEAVCILALQAKHWEFAVTLATWVQPIASLWH